MDEDEQEILQNQFMAFLNKQQAEMIQDTEDVTNFMKGLSEEDLNTLYDFFSFMLGLEEGDLPSFIAHWSGFMRAVMLMKFNIDPSIQMSSPADFDKLLELGNTA